MSTPMKRDFANRDELIAYVRSEFEIDSDEISTRLADDELLKSALDAIDPTSV